MAQVTTFFELFYPNGRIPAVEEVEDGVLFGLQGTDEGTLVAGGGGNEWTIEELVTAIRADLTDPLILPVQAIAEQQDENTVLLQAIQNFLSSETYYTLVLEENQYTSRSILELMVGRTNVLKWANLENDDEEEAAVATLIDDRIMFAISRAGARLHELLARSRYNLPLTPLSEELVANVTGLAACYLYEARGALEFDQQTNTVEHQLAFYRKRFESYVKNILAGRIIFEDQSVAKTLQTTPSVT